MQPLLGLVAAFVLLGHVRAMYPVQPPYVCLPLPRVIGSSVSAYYERFDSLVAIETPCLCSGPSTWRSHPRSRGGLPSF